LSAAGVRVETGCVVSQVRWKRHQVEVKPADDREFSAKQAVVTLPLGVLQSGSVRFSPTLSKKQAAMKKLHMGEVIRVGLRFRERFWDGIRPKPGGATLRRMGFLFSHDDVFP